MTDTITFGELTAQFISLSIEDKKKFYDFAKAFVFGNIHSNQSRLCTEQKFSDGVKCLKCGSSNIKKHGFIGCEIRHQRYLCKDCHKTFTELHNSPLHGTKKDAETWYKYIVLMLTGGYSLRKLKKELKINLKTAFYWRHKILYALHDWMKKDEVGGVVETDETYFLESFKGQRQLARKSRKRGGKANKRGISNEQICVMTSADHDGNYLAYLVCQGRINHKDVNRFFNNRIKANSILVTDEHKSYVRFAKDNNFVLKQIRRGQHTVDKVYHIQHINAFHGKLKGFIGRFNGVATKYLANYITWCKFAVVTKSIKFEDCCNQLMQISETVDKKTRIIDFKKMTPAFI
jgi:transposase-like protein